MGEGGGETEIEGGFVGKRTKGGIHPEWEGDKRVMGSECDENNCMYVCMYENVIMKSTRCN